MPNRRTFLMQSIAASAVAAANAQIVDDVSDVPTVETKKSMGIYKIPHTDLAVSRIAYGCADLGGWKNESLGIDAVANAVRLINSAYDNGITLFDLANIYGFGRSEEAFGEVLRRSPGLRNNIVIQTKFGRTRPLDPQLVVDTSRENILKSAESSLRRLDTDHLDIFLLHQPDELIEPEEVAKAFDELKRSGKVRYFGVSNHTPTQIEFLKVTLQQPLIVNQIYLGLAHTAPVSDGTVDYCRLKGIQVQAYSPLRGLLGSKPNGTQQTKEVMQLLAGVATRKNTSLYAIALAWLLRHPAGIVPVIGTTNPKHIADNCTADDVILNRDEWYSILRSASKAWPD